MKKQLLTMVGLIGATVAPVAAVVSCGNSGSQSDGPVTLDWGSEKPLDAPWSADKVKDKKFASAVSDPENPRWQAARQHISYNAQDAGFDTSTTIRKDQGDMNSWLDTHQNADVWVLGATSDDIAQSIKNFSGPVVAYDRLINADIENYNWYVSYDNYLVGRLQGISIINSVFGTNFDEKSTNAQIETGVKASTIKVKPDSLIFSLGGDPADNNATLFFNGAKDVLDLAMNAKDKTGQTVKWATGADVFETVAQAKWDYDKGKEYLSSQLSAQKIITVDQVAAILCPNDGMAKSAILSLIDIFHDAKTIAPIYITGQDCNSYALDSIRNDKGQDMSIFKPDSVATKVAVAVATELVIKKDASKDEVMAFIEKAYPALKDKYAFDDKKSYKVKSGKVINTILLTPQVVKKDDLGTYFDLSKIVSS